MTTPAERYAALVTEKMPVSHYAALALLPCDKGAIRLNVAREKLLGVRATAPDTLQVFVVRETFTETTSEIRITHRGVRIIELLDVGSDEWDVWSDKVTMVKLPQPEVTLRYGVRRTPAEERDRARWEEACHRPGSDSRLGQRDSYARALEGYTPDAQVKNVWDVPTTFSTAK